MLRVMLFKSFAEAVLGPSKVQVERAILRVLGAGSSDARRAASPSGVDQPAIEPEDQIGRASCRERVSPRV